jgi:hypothetical protein
MDVLACGQMDEGFKAAMLVLSGQYLSAPPHLSKGWTVLEQQYNVTSTTTRNILSPSSFAATQEFYRYDTIEPLLRSADHFFSLLYDGRIHIPLTALGWKRKYDAPRADLFVQANRMVYSFLLKGTVDAKAAGDLLASLLDARIPASSFEAFSTLSAADQLAVHRARVLQFLKRQSLNFICSAILALSAAIVQWEKAVTAAVRRVEHLVAVSKDIRAHQDAQYLSLTPPFCNVCGGSESSSSNELILCDGCLASGKFRAPASVHILLLNICLWFSITGDEQRVLFGGFHYKCEGCTPAVFCKAVAFCSRLCAVQNKKSQKVSSSHQLSCPLALSPLAFLLTFPNHNPYRN